MFQSQNLMFTPYVREDWETLARWAHSPLYKDMWRHHPATFQIEELMGYQTNLGGEAYIIRRKDPANQFPPIGIVQLVKDGKTNRGLHFGLLIDINNRSKGEILETLVTVFNYAFNTLGYRKIIIEVLESNTDLVKLLQKTGFIQEGRLLGESFMDGKFVNEVRFCMFDEYFNRHYKEMVMA